MRNLSVRLLGLLFTILMVPPSLVAQQDTSSYFPLGLWGIWLDPGIPSI
jgi:hypothetical protein